MCTVFIDISMASQTAPTLDTMLNTHVPSLRTVNSNPDECEPTALVIPGPISFCSQEQGHRCFCLGDRCVQ